MTHPLIVRLSVVCLLGCLWTGCATRGWVRVEQAPMIGPDEAFRVELPVGWIHAAFYSKQIYITKDGPDIQMIRVIKMSHDDAFSIIGKKSSPDMLPSELAELAIAGIKTDAGMTNVDIIANEPALIDGRAGFRLHLRFKNAEGLGYESVFYGFADDTGVYSMAYRAASIHYFARDLETFEKVVRSFHVAPRDQSPAG